MYKTISYIDQGQGTALVLLHGYLETMEMWQGVLPELAKHFRVICPDMPGHGKSPAQENQTIESMGEAVISLMDELKIQNFNLAGHSMGGYVSLAMAEKHPERIIRIALLHSHTYADAPEKAANRLRETVLISRRKKELIINFAIPNLFAPDFAEKHPDIVDKAIEMALTTPDDGMIACLKAMAERPDRTAVFKNLKQDRLMILGKNDNLISWQTLKEEFGNVPGIKIKLLEKAAHMGITEEPQAFVKALMEGFGL